MRNEPETLAVVIDGTTHHDTKILKMRIHPRTKGSAFVGDVWFNLFQPCMTNGEDQLISPVQQISLNLNEARSLVQHITTAIADATRDPEV